MAQKSNNLTVYPILQLDNGVYNVSAEFLATIWQHLEAQNKIESLFYDGIIRDATGFVAYMLSPAVFPILVIDETKKQVVHIAWLKDCFDGCAWVHHVAVGPYRRGVWEVCREHWQKMKIIHLLLGLTPTSNAKAVKFLKKICKFTVVGEVPYVCNMAYEGRRVPGIISYFELQSQEVRPEVAAPEPEGGQPWVAAEKAEKAAAAESVSSPAPTNSN